MAISTDSGITISAITATSWSHQQRRHDGGDDVGEQDRHRADVHAEHHPLELTPAERAGAPEVAGEDDERGDDEDDVDGEHGAKARLRRQRHPEDPAQRDRPEEREQPWPPRQPPAGGRDLGGKDQQRAQDQRQHHQRGAEEDHHPG